MDRPWRRRCTIALHVGALLTSPLLVAGCASPTGSSQTVGTLSTITPRLCVAGPTGNGDCFRNVQVLHRAKLGDCVLATTRRRRGVQLATDIRSVDPLNWPDACPLPLAPKRPAGESSCASLYTVEIQGHDGDPSLRLAPGGCAGALDPRQPLIPVWVRPGDRVVIHGLAADERVTEDPSALQSRNGSVLRPVRNSGRTATWLVSHPGRAELLVATPYCGSYRGPKEPTPDQWQSCPEVSVLAKNRG
jgi:hypothetical protein